MAGERIRPLRVLRTVCRFRCGAQAKEASLDPGGSEPSVGSLHTYGALLLCTSAPAELRSGCMCHYIYSCLSCAYVIIFRQA